MKPYGLMHPPCQWCGESLPKWCQKYCQRPKYCRDYAYRQRRRAIPANVRFKAKKAVKPPITLSFLARETGIHIGKLSQFIHKNLDIEQEEVDRIYAVLNVSKLPGAISIRGTLPLHRNTVGAVENVI